jgi:cob(I)alamin adenosyltransferase
MSETNNKKKGLFIIYTGNGKGKTTAAVGLAVRAAGYGRKVLFLQFIKEWFTGEKESLGKLAPHVEFKQMGEGFVGIWGDRKDREVHSNAAQEAFAHAREVVKNRLYDVYIFDELNVAISEGLVSVEQVVELVEIKDEFADIVLTGRGAHGQLIKLADLVSEMTEIKHPFQKGILAKRSIDF